MTTQSVLTLAQVNWRYEDGQALALRDINLALHPGEVVGVVGPSGAGKTTLLLTLAGLIPTNYSGTFSGERRSVGQIGVVFQDPETQFIGLTVEEEIAFSLENQGYNDQQIEQRIDEMLQLVRLDGFLQRSPFQLSGGEKQRVAIASALAGSPELLILDEPTSELDPKGAKEVFSLLHKLKREENMTIVVSSHATEELAPFCDRMLLISSGSIIYDLPTRAFFSQANQLREHGIFIPEMVQLYFWLLEQGIVKDHTKPPLSVEEMVALYRQLPRKQEVGR